jgi:type I restriction enzyme R subunit
LATRRFEHKGKSYPVSQNNIEEILEILTNIPLNEGLLHANQKLYDHLFSGITVTEFIDGKKTSKTIAVIDWKNIEKNHFCYTEEFAVRRGGTMSHRIPDIVCFVNGLPWVIIEAKRPDGHKTPTVEEGISQMLRNQQSDEIPQLFIYAQLLLSISHTEGRYGTVETPAKFWLQWREEDFTIDTMKKIKNAKLSPAVMTPLFSYRNPAIKDWYSHLIAQGDLAVAGQDKLIISLLTQKRLLEITKLFILFDKKNGKIVARYPQFFGIQRLIERLTTFDKNGARQGGVIWHTTGSGKSYTMIFLSKVLLVHPALQECRLIVITDRTDLETQLSGNFIASGELESKRDSEAAMATSGKRLAEQIGEGTEPLIFSLIQKFNTATKLPKCHNASPNLIVLVDEGHRSQGGENHARMRNALPHAAFIAFTGTPLLKNDKTTEQFGPIVHAYTMQRAEEDGAVTPLLYEERVPELDINDRAIDLWFERITEGLTEKQKSDLKKKYATKGAINNADDRIHLIALDIANHFVKYFNHTGLKAQLACESKVAAIKYKKYLDETELFESALVMSPPDTREGNSSVDESTLPAVTKWWKDNVGTQDEKTYTKNVITRFKNDPDLKMLIVVDKLLTGFDEPKNTVLYMDKPLKNHDLIQAIARVNRLHDEKDKGFLIDYRGILKELDTTIAAYQDLATKTQSGYAIEDIQGMYHSISSEYKRLPMLYDALWAIFKDIKSTGDFEQLRQVLLPDMKEIEGEWVDLNLKRREDFYEALSHFSACLAVALRSASFYQDTLFTEMDRKKYKETARELSNLKRRVQEDLGEKIEYKKYETGIEQLLDKHIIGLEVHSPEVRYAVSEMGQQKPEEWNAEKTRNQTAIIEARVTKTIEQSLQDDPYAYASFSTMLRKVLEETKSLFEHPLKAYRMMEDFEQQVNTRRVEDIPDCFNGNYRAQAYYGIFKQTLPDLFEWMEDETQEAWIKLCFNIDEVIKTVIAENSLNAQNIEASTRKKLLPIFFKLGQEKDFDFDMAKTLTEKFIQVLRVQLDRL